MKSKVSVVFLMVCLAFFIVLLSCVKKASKESTEPENIYAIQGRIMYWEDNTGVVGVPVELTGLYRSETTTTDSTGSYFFIDCQAGPYTVSPLEPPSNEYYYTHQGREVFVEESDITVMEFYLIKYPSLVLINNSPRKITTVQVARVTDPEAWGANLIENGLLPYSDSQEIRIMPGTWNMQLTYLEDSEIKTVLIDGLIIKPEENAIYPLTSILKINNIGSNILVGVSVSKCDTQRWVAYHLKNEAPPGSVSEDIYIWNVAECLDMLLNYPIDTDLLSYVWVRSVHITPGDTVNVIFEE